MLAKEQKNIPAKEFLSRIYKKKSSYLSQAENISSKVYLTHYSGRTQNVSFAFRSSQAKKNQSSSRSNYSQTTINMPEMKVMQFI